MFLAYKTEDIFISKIFKTVFFLQFTPKEEIKKIQNNQFSTKNKGCHPYPHSNARWGGNIQKYPIKPDIMNLWVKLNLSYQKSRGLLSIQTLAKVILKK